MKKSVEIINKRTGGTRIFFGVVCGILIVYCAMLIYPFLWMFQQSLKGQFEYFVAGPFEFAADPQWNNYIRVFESITVRAKGKQVGFLMMLFNSIWQTVGPTAIGMFFSCIVAYCLSKYKFGVRNFMYAVIIFMMVYPSMGTGGAAYKQAQDLGIFDSPLMMVKSMGGYSGMGFFVLYSFFSTLPWDYADAAFIDGANDYQVFFKIMLPMAMGPIMAMSIVSAIGGWNGYMGNLMYYPSYPILTAGLYLYESNMVRAVDYPLYFTGVIITMLPVIALFIVFQDSIMKNVSVGGLKG